MLTLALTQLAVAQTLDQRKADAQSEVSRNEQRLEDAVEKYKYACSRLEQTRGLISENTANIHQAEEELAARRQTLSKRIRALYVSRSAEFVDIVVSSHNINQFVVGIDLLKKVGRNDATLVRSVKEARARLEATRQNLAAQKAEQEAARQQVTDSKAAVEAELAQSKGKLANVQEEIRAMMARQAEESRLAGARSSQYSAINVIRNPVPPGTPHPGVVGVAYDQLGKPYVWGATGPSSFDCSGLTSYCYRVGAGMSIPRNSYGQATLPSVPVSQLAPGDILGFRGWGHVGLYVGNGQFIHAPSSGDVVKVTALSSRGNFAGAVRP
jgi:cell wall-associated NlpC family hydrolase